jgi:hypothetical protein
MAFADRAALANPAMDAALNTIVGYIPTWIGNGGKTEDLIKAILGALTTADPGLARYIERRFGSSALYGVKTAANSAVAANSGTPITISTNDTAP